MSNVKNKDSVLQLMRKAQIPTTKEMYLRVAFLGSPPEFIDAETEADMPEDLPFEEVERYQAMAAEPYVLVAEVIAHVFALESLFQKVEEHTQTMRTLYVLWESLSDATPEWTLDHQCAAWKFGRVQ